ncbi:MAG: hypothetical protein ACXWJB_14235 [Limisphaerales bacterium]
MAPDPKSQSANSLKGAAARFAAIISLKSEIQRLLAKQDTDSANRKARVLINLITVFKRKDAANGLPPEIADVDNFVREMASDGLPISTIAFEERKRKRLDRKERKTNEQIRECVQSMVRRTARRQPKPKRSPRLIYTAFETKRASH